MKYLYLLFSLGFISAHFCPQHLLADEAFVILEYNKSVISRGKTDANYIVQPGDTLAQIVAQHYGNVPNQRELFSQIVSQNPRAFVGGNPNRLLSGVTINLSASEAPPGNMRDEIFFF